MHVSFQVYWSSPGQPSFLPPFLSRRVNQLCRASAPVSTSSIKHAPWGTMSITTKSHFYSIVIAIHPSEDTSEIEEPAEDWRLGEINVDWVDFTREKSVDRPADMQSDTHPLATPASSSSASARRKGERESQRSVPGSGAGTSPTPAERKKRAPGSSDPDSLSLQPLLAHFPGPNPLDSSVAQGVSSVGRGVVHLFRHAPPAHLIASLESHPVGEGSGSTARAAGGGSKDEWSGDRAEGEDGSLIAILAVPAWMRPADFLEFIGGWGTCLEGVRMIRCVIQLPLSPGAGDVRTDLMYTLQGGNHAQSLYSPAQVSRSPSGVRLPGHLYRSGIFDPGLEGDMPSDPHTPPRAPQARHGHQTQVDHLSPCLPTFSLRIASQGSPRLGDWRSQLFQIRTPLLSSLPRTSRLDGYRPRHPPLRPYIRL